MAQAWRFRGRVAALAVSAAAVMRLVAGERHIAVGVTHSCFVVNGTLAIVCDGRPGTHAALLGTATPGPFHGVTAGANFTCGLFTNHTAACWGALPGITAGPIAPLLGPGGQPAEFLEVHAGSGRHACGLAFDGAVACYGDDATGAVSGVPRGVAFAGVTAAPGYTCGAARNGTVLCWGDPANPVVAGPYPAGGVWVHIAAGDRHACALSGNGSVACWGAVTHIPLPQPGGGYASLTAGGNRTCGITHRSRQVVCAGSVLSFVEQEIKEYACGRGWCDSVTSVGKVSQTPRMSTEARSWQAIASCADGMRLVAAASGGQLWVSSDGGVTWTARESARSWRAVASSSDGMRLVASVDNGQLWVSIDGGVTWTARESARGWRAVASSSDGMRLLASASGGQLWVSSDGGVTWTARESARGWLALASSSDGLRLVAAASGGQLYVSSDGGVTWTARESARGWRAVASSSDGMRLAAAASSDQLYVSSDGGVAWTARKSARGWQAVASSNDGMRLLASASGGQLWVSSDGGVTWTARESARGWQAVASSSDGTRLVAAAWSGQLYVSSDGGVTWTARESVRGWRAVASSSDGMRLLAAASGGQLYVSSDGGVTWTARESVRDWRAVASSSDGTRLVAAASSDQLYMSNGQLQVSSDGGVTWTARESARSWQAVASSSDGMRLLAAASGGQLYVSSDGGVTWTARESEREWRAAVSSSDGLRLAAASSDQLFVSSDGGVTWTARESEREWRAVASSSDGMWLVAAVTGDFPRVMAVSSLMADVSQVLRARLQYEGLHALKAVRMMGGPVAPSCIDCTGPLAALSSTQLAAWNPSLRSVRIGSPTVVTFVSPGAFRTVVIDEVGFASGAGVRLTAGSFKGLDRWSRINSATAGTVDLSGTGAHVESPGNWSWDALSGLNIAAITTINLAGNSITAFHPSHLQFPAATAVMVCPGNPGVVTALQTPGAFAHFPLARVFTTAGTPTAGTMSFRSCGATAVDVRAFASPLVGGITAVDLSDNALTSLRNASSLLRELLHPAYSAALLSVNLAGNRIGRIDAGDADGWANLQSLDLSNNAIAFIDEAAFSPLVHRLLRMVIFAGNPVDTLGCLAGFRRTTITLPAGATVPVCAVCQPGFHCDGSSTAAPCPAGRFNDLAGQSSASACQPCPAGTTNAMTGQTRQGCLFCPVGTANARAGASSSLDCLLCAAGTYASSVGAAECAECPVGSWSNTTGARSTAFCHLCPTGTYSSAAGASSATVCTACPSGATTLAPGASSALSCVAEQCPAGTARVVSADLRTSCQACPAGRFAAAGDATCSLCPPGSFSALPGAAACQRCPAGRYRSGAGGNNSEACVACPLGTRCRGDRTGCDALCPSGSVVAAAASAGDVNAAALVCDAAPPAALCSRCANDSSVLCVPGALAAAPSLLALRPAAAQRLAGEQTGAEIAASLPAAGAAWGVSQPGDCATFARASLIDQPAAAYQFARTALLGGTGVAAFAIPALLVLLSRTRAGSELKRFVPRLDQFASRHRPKTADRVMREQSTFTGGLFSVAFVVAALGLSASVFMQLSLHPFALTRALVDVPASQDGSGTAAAGLQVRLLAVGPPGDDCGAVAGRSLYASPGWSVASAGSLPLATSGLAAAHGLTVLPPGLAAASSCELRYACAACQATAPTTLRLSLPPAFQSLHVTLRGAEALPGCGVEQGVVVAAPGADALLSTAALSVRMVPVAFTYSGSLGAGRLRDGAGVDLRFTGHDVAFDPQPTLLQPDTDAVVVTIAFTPTPYTTSITVADSVDATTVVASLVGFLTGVSSAAVVLMRRVEGVRSTAEVKRFLRSKARTAELAQGGPLASAPPASLPDGASFTSNPLMAGASVTAGAIRGAHATAIGSGAVDAGMSGLAHTSAPTTGAGARLGLRVHRGGGGVGRVLVSFDAKHVG
jgi:ribosomal protein L24E